MNIGIDSRAAKWYRGTGIGTYVYEIIDSLNKIDNNNNYTLYLPSNFSYIAFKKNFIIKNVLENNETIFWEEVNIPNNITNDNLSLYHIPQNGIGFPKNKTCPIIITLHDVIPYKMPETVSETYLKIFFEQIPKIISQSDGIITVSNYSKKDIIETLNYPEEKIFVTPLASEKIYKPLNRKSCKNFIKNYYGIEDPFILYIGGFSPRKNISSLIEAFSKIKNKKNLKLVIGGRKGKSYSIYKQRAIELGIENKIIFPGFIPIEHLPIFYNSAKIFVYPSLYEGFGLPPIEAMACATPVIASNKTSIPEILDDAAYLINPQDIDDLYNSIITLLENDNLRYDLITKGLIKSKTFTWEDTAINTLKAYKKTYNTFN